MKQFFDMLQDIAFTGTEDTVVAHFDKVLWQDMLQEASDEGFCIQCCCMPFAFIVLIAESNHSILEIGNTLVGDCYAKDIGSEIL